MDKPNESFAKNNDQSVETTNPPIKDDPNIGSVRNNGVVYLLGKLEGHLDTNDKTIEKIEIDMRSLGKKVDNHFLIVWGGMIFGGLGILTLIANSAGWLNGDKINILKGCLC